MNGTVASLNFKQSTGEFNGIAWPLSASPVLHNNDVYIHIHKGNSTATVFVNLFGNIEIK